jgi:hypothetical protein
MKPLSRTEILHAAACFCLPAMPAVCTTLMERQVRCFVDVPEDGGVLVGRIEPHSPLGKDEQFLETSLGKSFAGRLILMQR